MTNVCLNFFESYLQEQWHRPGHESKHLRTIFLAQPVVWLMPPKPSCSPLSLLCARFHWVHPASISGPRGSFASMVLGWRSLLEQKLVHDHSLLLAPANTWNLGVCKAINPVSGARGTQHWGSPVAFKEKRHTRRIEWGNNFRYSWV